MNNEAVRTQRVVLVPEFEKVVQKNVIAILSDTIKISKEMRDTTKDIAAWGICRHLCILINNYLRASYEYGVNMVGADETVCMLSTLRLLGALRARQL